MRSEAQLSLASTPSVKVAEIFGDANAEITDDGLECSFSSFRRLFYLYCNSDGESLRGKPERVTWVGLNEVTLSVLSFYRPKDGKEDLGPHAYTIRNSSCRLYARVYGDLSVSMRLASPYECGSA